MIDWNTAATAIVSGVGGVGVTLLALRRRLSSDNTAIAVDEAQTSFVQTLMKERDEAIRHVRECHDQRTLLAVEVGRQRELLSASERERSRLALDFASFRRMVLRVHPDMEDYIVSNYGELSEPEPPKT